MSPELLILLVLSPTAAVVAALCFIMWRARSPATAPTVLVSGAVLALWAITAAVLATRGVFLQPDEQALPPVGIALLIIFAVLGAALSGSASLRSLLTNQRHLIRLNVWRLEGIVFLLLMFAGQMPALWALPAGIGDILVGATAFWVAARLSTPHGTRTAIRFNLFGLADLVVAVGLAMMTSPGPARVFDTSPTSELVTRFPLVLVPTFLVPLAFALHIVSLLQLIGGSWARPVVSARRA